MAIQAVTSEKQAHDFCYAGYAKAVDICGCAKSVSSRSLDVWSKLQGKRIAFQVSVVKTWMRQVALQNAACGTYFGRLNRSQRGFVRGASYQVSRRDGISPDFITSAFFMRRAAGGSARTFRKTLSWPDRKRQHWVSTSPSRRMD